MKFYQPFLRPWKYIEEFPQPWTKEVERVENFEMLENQNIEVIGWDKEIIEFCAIMLKLEETFASAKPINPYQFKPAAEQITAEQIKRLKTLVDNNLTSV